MERGFDSSLYYLKQEIQQETKNHRQDTTSVCGTCF